MRVLIACEYSGRVRDAFIAYGHDAMSCDLLPTEAEGPHYQGDVLDIIDDEWDMMIAHPPCTHLATSGNRWHAGTLERQEAIDFVTTLWLAKIPKIAIENPVGVLSTESILYKPTQVIQPWQFGHGETKATCLWLRGLPKLIPTNEVEEREQRILSISSGRAQAKERSLTYSGIAAAMAEQWG